MRLVSKPGVMARANLFCSTARGRGGGSTQAGVTLFRGCHCFFIFVAFGHFRPHAPSRGAAGPFRLQRAGAVPRCSLTRCLVRHEDSPEHRARTNRDGDHRDRRRRCRRVLPTHPKDPVRVRSEGVPSAAVDVRRRPLVAARLVIAAAKGGGVRVRIGGRSLIPQMSYASAVD